MPKIILCRGIQGSGKSTWAKKYILEDSENRVRFNNDDIRICKIAYSEWNNPKETHSDEYRSKYEIETKDFFIPLQECIDRDAKRENPIGEEIIRKTYEKYKGLIES